METMQFHITKMDFFVMNISFNRSCSIQTDFLFPLPEKNLLNRSEKIVS